MNTVLNLSLDKTLIERKKIFRSLSGISGINAKTADKTLRSKFTDFEDAVQPFSNTGTGVDYIISRNQKDYNTQ